MDPEAKTGVEEVPAAVEPVAAATEQPAVSQPDTGANGVVLADGQTTTDKTVPYSRFEEVNTANKTAQEQIAQLQAQNQILAQQQSSVPQSKPTNLYDQTVQQLGLQDESYLTNEMQGQVFNTMFQAISVQQSDASFVESHSDYAQVVGTSDATGRFIPAAPLQRVLAKDPQLLQAINSSSQGKRIAYKLAVSDPEYQKSIAKAGLSPEVRAAADAKAIVAAANGQASISAAGTGQGNLDKAAVVANYTDEEFKAYKEKIMARAT